MSRRVSFIITARNEPETILEVTLDGLRATSRHVDREVIVIDDGSDEPVACHDSEVRLKRNRRARGCAPARAQGAALATGQTLVWLDAHMTFSPDWLNEMLIHADTGSLLCSAFWDYQQEICHCWGAEFEWVGTRDLSVQRSPGFWVRHLTRFPGNGAPEVPMVIGACYMMQRESYERLGGFSPLFKVWGVDEQDMSARAWIAGMGVRCVTAARVGHRWRPSFPYPVEYAHLDFNQLVLIRSLFEEPTVAALERFFEPLPPEVGEWLDEAELPRWREKVQSCRRFSDAEFFERFAPELAAHAVP